MRSASAAAARILARAAFFDWIGSYSGSKSFSMLTPSWLLGRSMMWPFEAITWNPRPRNFESVRDLVGDSTITSERPRPFEPAAASGGAVAARARAVPFFARAGFLPAAGATPGLARLRAARRGAGARSAAPERAGAAASVSAALTGSAGTRFG